MAVERWLENRLKELQERDHGKPVSEEDYKISFRESPRKVHLIAHCVIFNGEGQRVGSIDLNVTDRRNVVFVGLEDEFDCKPEQHKETTLTKKQEN